ncbi:MAG: hypothetical protein ABI430_04580 [Candidatus Taylorbacteria bacterium]
MNMKKFSSTKQIGVVAILLNIAIFSACVILFLNIQKKKQVILAVAQEQSLQSLQESNYLSFKKTMENTKTDREKLDSFFVGGDGVVPFIELVEGQGRLSGATTSITSVGTVKSASASSSIEVLNLQVEAAAGWKSLYHFLSLLENLPYRIALANVAMKTDQGGKKGYWEASFVLKVLKLKGGP